ncbi:DUF4349 domain-containing protein [Aquimarina sp. 2304DJ70-9]|uniref:DUF4349 domain-containing protein n=1 Tax=Aquimarina penaris TaxID=3231044 RepID=UPI003462D4BC
MKSNKLNRRKVVLLLGVLMFGFSCSKEASNYDVASEIIALDETGEMPNLNSHELEGKEIQKKENINANLKVIKNATSRIKVKNVEKATLHAKQIALQYQGYVSDERFTNTNHTKENRFTIRIPREHFDTVLDQICKSAEFVDHKNISTIDVTEEYIDLSSRLKTKLEVKQRYETILRDNAKTVKDILATEDKLKELQEEIEATQGRLNYISARVVYSTIQLDMYEVVIPKEEPEQYTPSFLDKAQAGLSFGWSLVEHAALVLFYIWPFIVLGTLVLVYFKWIRK